jgi:hypothetical protein
MSLLERLAEPAFAKDHVIRPSARALGFLVAAFSALTCLGAVAELGEFFPLRWYDPITPIQIILGALLPQLLAVVGGVWMLTGDARGKRLVVLAIPVGFLYATASAMQMAGAFADGAGLVLMGTAINVVIAAFLYYLVVTSQVGTDPRKGRRILSAAVLVAVCAVVIVAGIWVAGVLGPSDTTYAFSPVGAEPLRS